MKKKTQSIIRYKTEIYGDNIFRSCSLQFKNYNIAVNAKTETV